MRNTTMPKYNALFHETLILKGNIRPRHVLMYNQSPKHRIYLKRGPNG